MALIGIPHLYQDCSNLQALVDAIGAPRGFHKRQAIRRDAPIVGRIQCNDCIARMELEALTIDDFNSVWFGLGPDFCTVPVEPGS